jgi:hypothetical protein
VRLLVLIATLVCTATALAKGATITAQPFTDSCRDVSFNSDKDISHVVIYYADGRVVRDETIDSPDYSINGGAGDEIDSVDVKSGTTKKSFTCTATNSPPTAMLEMRTPAIDDPSGDCSSQFSPPDLYCGYIGPRTVWTPWEPGTVVWFFCGETTFSFDFRGTSSTDPDGDLASWSLDFGDGTSASGDWTTTPPTEVAHTYDFADFTTERSIVVATLTVTDAAGQSDSDTLTTGHANACPD